MAGPSFEQEIVSHLHRLSPEQKMQVLAFVRALKEQELSGVPGTELLMFAGPSIWTILRKWKRQ